MSADEVVALSVQALTALYSSSDNADKWIMNSGASRPMSGENSHFENYSEFNNYIDITFSDRCLWAVGQGDIYVSSNGNSKYVLIDVLYVTELSFN